MEAEEQHEVEDAGEQHGFHVPTHSVSPSSAAAPSFLSLFPVTVAGARETSNAECQGWLSLSSFSQSLLPPPSTLSYRAELQEDEEIKEKASASKYEHHEPEYKIVSSSTEFASTDSEYKSVQKKSKKKRRRKHRKEEEEKKKALRKKDLKLQGDASKIGSLKGLADRKATTGIWADIQTNLSKDYYFDTHGDRDNLAFGSLYRMDVARYQLYKSTGAYELNFGKSHKVNTRFIDLDRDTDNQDDKSGARYWSFKFASLDKKRNLRRLHIRSSHFGGKRKNLFGLLKSFIPLDMQLSAEGQERVESWEEYIVRKTKLLNELTRERPQDESLWIDFANFQDELVNSRNKKVLVQQAIDKKIAVLEKSLQFVPDSEDLLLLYLEACSKRDDTSLVLSKWETAIQKHAHSYRMWRGFFRFRCSNFSLFSVSSLRKVYVQAIQSFVFWRERLHRENVQKARGVSYESKMLEAELALVSLFVNLCRFEWQTGHHELAIGLFQAELEFTLLCPPIQSSEKNKHRLFEDFWNSGALRVGEQGSVGWATWLSKEEEQIQRARASTFANDESTEESGGWTGWSQPQDFSGKILELDEVNILNDIENLDDQENIEDEASQEEDDATLLQKLGLNLDVGEEVKVQDSNIWKRWSDKELHRDIEQWLPLHSKNNRAAVSATDDFNSEGDDEQLERMVLYEDVREYLFSLETEQARVELVSQFVQFCDGPLPQWCCSNNRNSIENIETYENIRGPVLEQILDSIPDEKEFLNGMFGGLQWFSESSGRTSFIRNCLLLLRPVIPNLLGFQKAVLKIEDLEAAERGESDKAYASRTLAKKLLKNSRQDITLWTTYACVEADAGKLDVARKVFDTALTSLNALPTQARLDAPLLYLAYAEAELAQGLKGHFSDKKMKDYPHCNRVLYIMYFLGSGDSYFPATENHSLAATQLLKARQGFRDHMQKLRRKADIDDRGAALISCAALFEELSTGWEAAARVFEEGFAICLPGKRQHCIHFELLFCRYVAMLEDHKGPVKPGHLRHIICQGLALYPTNENIISAYIRSSSQLASTNAIRRFFDEALQKHPTTLLYIFALSCELWRPGAGSRTHSLFERALESANTHQSVVIWRCYLAYELQVRHDPDAARRVFFRAIHACPWSKQLWLDGFQKMSKILTAKEQSDFADIMRDKELRVRTDVYEILLEEAGEA